MAITIIDSPQLVMPVYNDIVWTVDSTNKSQCDFRYICDIYVNGSFVTRLKLFPMDVNGYASFKVNRILEDYVSFDLHQNLFGSTYNVNSSCYYTLKFGEEYDSSVSCTSGSTPYPDLTVGTKSYAINAALQYKEWKSWDYTKYSTNATTRKFLSNIPNNTLIASNEQFVLNYIDLAANTSGLRVEWTIYDETGTIIVQVRQILNTSFPDQIVRSVGVGPNNFVNYYSGAYLGSYYTVSLVNSSYIRVSELKTFVFNNKKPSLYDPKRLWWLNRLGGFDSYSYTLKNTSKVAIQNKQFSKLIGGLQGSPTDWTYNIGDRNATVMSVDAQETNTYSSNWLTQLEANWQQELFTSPEVYLNKPALKFEFINVISNGGSPNMCRLKFNKESDLSDVIVGNQVFINVCDGGSYSTCNITAVSATSNYIDIDESYPSPYSSGYIVVKGSSSELDPIVITSKSYEEKFTKISKNVNYTIEVQKAYPINIQRN
jgi:hypothetical protein